MPYPGEDHLVDELETVGQENDRTVVLRFRGIAFLLVDWGQESVTHFLGESVENTICIGQGWIERACSENVVDQWKKSFTNRFTLEDFSMQIIGSDRLVGSSVDCCELDFFQRERSREDGPWRRMDGWRRVVGLKRRSRSTHEGLEVIVEVARWNGRRETGRVHLAFKNMLPRNPRVFDEQVGVGRHK